jgi:hypothetical protein
VDEATIERCPCDFPHFAERHLKVRNERGELVPLILSKVQLEIVSWEGCRSRREAVPGGNAHNNVGRVK